MMKSVRTVTIDGADGCAVTCVEAVRLRAPLAFAPPRPGGEPPILDNLIIRVRLADGTIGYGEAALYPGLTEDAPTALTAVNAIADELCVYTRPPASLPAATRCGLEQALLDAAARRSGRSLAVYLGGDPGSLPTAITVLALDIPRAVHAAAEAVEAGFTEIKAKTSGDWRADLERLSAMAAAVPGAALRMDANGRFSYAEAARLLTGLRARGVALTLLEQPLAPADLAGLVRLEREHGTPICADESVRSRGDLVRLIELGGVSTVCVKVMRSGVRETRRLLSAAAAAGMAAVVSGSSDSIVATSFTAALAAAHRPVVRHTDLDTPLFLPPSLVHGGVTYDLGRVVVPDLPGTGIDGARLFPAYVAEAS